MRCGLRSGLIGECPAAKQSAVGYYVLFVRVNYSLYRERARLVAVKLKGSQKVYVFDRPDTPTGKQAHGGFGKRLEAHNAGKNRPAFDLVVIEEWLHFGIERGFNRQGAEHTSRDNRAQGQVLRDRTLLPRNFWGRWIEASGGIPFFQQNTETLSDYNFTRGSTRSQLAADHRNARLRCQHFDTCHFHHLGYRPAGGHT